MKHRTGFTLVELLIVIAIIGILIAMLLPAVNGVREAARRMQCRNHVKQIALALHTYHESHDELPPGGNFPDDTNPTWAAAILPQLEQQSVYDLFDFDVAIHHASNRPAVQTVIPTYICPSDPAASDPLQGGRVGAGNHNAAKSMGLWYPGSMGPTRDGYSTGTSCVYCPEPLGSYCCADTGDFGSYGPPGVGLFDRENHPVRFSMIRDGLSNTFMIGETLPAQCAYNGAYNHNFPIAGTSIPLNTMEEGADGVNNYWYTACGIKSRHPGGAHFLMADSSVHFLDENIDYVNYQRLGDRRDGEIVSLEP